MELNITKRKVYSSALHPVNDSITYLAERTGSARPA